MKIELPKTIAVGDPVAICVGGGMIKWTEDCGYDMVGILPQGSTMVRGALIVPGWFATQINGWCCR
jgi:hypothetical protein